MNLFGYGERDDTSCTVLVRERDAECLRGRVRFETRTGKKDEDRNEKIGLGPKALFRRGVRPRRGGRGYYEWFKISPLLKVCREEKWCASEECISWISRGKFATRLFLIWRGGEVFWKIAGQSCGEFGGCAGQLRCITGCLTTKQQVRKVQVLLHSRKEFLFRI
jgi:hypothetical protein